jgi:hypothetical protein
MPIKILMDEILLSPTECGRGAAELANRRLGQKFARLADFTPKVIHLKKKNSPSRK